MSQVENLITQHLDIWTQATEAKSTAGRGTRGKINLLGIQKLRELILEMAVRGLLVPQDPNDEPASELLKKIAAEKAQLIKDGKIKKTKPLPDITDDEKPFELPNGWEWVQNLAIFELVKGKKPKSLSEKKGSYPYLDIEALDRGNILRFTDDTSAPKCTSNDLLIVCDGSRSGLVLEGQNGVIGSTLARIDTSDYLKLFLKLFFQNAYQHLNSSLKGAAIPHLDTKKLRCGFMALPTLAEQARIVAKVDELMALCHALETQTLDSIATHQTLVETLLGNLVAHPVIARPQAAAISEPTEQDCVASLAMTEQKRLHQAFTPPCGVWLLIEQHFDVLFTTEHSIDTLKQTILQLAVMGKLVPQDPNDEPASELLKKIAAEKAQRIKDGKIKKSKPLPPITDDEKPFDLPNDWEWVRLADVIDVRDGTHDSPKDAIAGITYPLVTSKNFDNGEIDFKNARRISKEDHELIIQRSKVDKFDILFSMIGGNIGNQVMVTCDTEFSIKNVALFKYFDKSLTYPFFIKVYTENLAFNLQSEALGGAQPFVSLGKLRSLILALPPQAEQTRIAAKVNQLMTLCDQIKTQLQTAQHTQAQLAQTINQEALA